MTWEGTPAPAPAVVAVPPLPLGRLLPALGWLAAAQGGWPVREPSSPAHRQVGAGSFEQGLAEADAVADAGTDLLVLSASGDPVPALVATATLLALEPVAVVGTGVDAGWAARTVAVRDGLRSARTHADDPVGLLAALGDGPLGHLAGLLARSAGRRTPVVFDGSAFTAAAALVADRLVPGARHWWLAGQAPPSAAGAAALRELDLVPLLDLGLDLPEGAALAADVLLSAVELAVGRAADGA